MARRRNQTSRSVAPTLPAWARSRLHPAPLPDAHLKDDLSVLFAQSLATSIGVTCEVFKRDINGVDVLYRALDTDDADAEQLVVQLKCTVNRLTRVANGQELSMQIPADDYAQLRMPKAHPPRLLVVVELPHPSPTKWVIASRTDLLLDARAWYADLAGAPVLPAGQASKTVRIPAVQRFGPSTLHANMRSCP